MSKPKIKVLPDGRCVLSGIAFQDLSAILTSAYLDLVKPLRSRKLPKKSDPLYELAVANRKASSEWQRKMLWIIKALETSMETARRPPKPDTRDLKTILREKKEEREFLNMIIADAIKEMRK